VADIEKLKQRLRDEITRTQSGVRLDLNLEKGRMREESGGQELKIKEVDTRIEGEIATLRAAIQNSKASRFVDLPDATIILISSIRQQPCNISLVSVRVTPTGTPSGTDLGFSVTGCSALLMAYLRFRL
jgi:hypothetical protein